MWQLRLVIVFFPLLFSIQPVWAACTSIPASTPDIALLDNGDYTITDLATGLMWKQCSEGQASDSLCSGNPWTYNWQEALQVAEELNNSGGFAGFTDWRLPNLNELRSIVEESCVDPAINSSRFPNTPSVEYWVASALARFSNGAFYVNFYYGKGNAWIRDRVPYHVRLVRDAN